MSMNKKQTGEEAQKATADNDNDILLASQDKEAVENYLPKIVKMLDLD